MRFVFLLTSVGCLLASSAFAEPSLRMLPTQHYLIHTDLEPGFAADLARRMEAMYAEYTRRMREFKPPETAAKLEVYLFTHRADYDNLTEHKVPHTGGVFIAGKRNLLASFLEEQGRDTMRRTLQHEAFHQFAYNAIAENLPIWLNEGIAQFFEEGIWDGSNFRIGEIPPWRVRQLQDDIKNGRFIDLKKLFEMSPFEWAMRLSRDVAAGATEYNEAWAVVQFLAKGPGGNEPRLIAWMKAMHQGSIPSEAYVSAFTESPEQIQPHFLEWVRTLQPTERATVVDHHKILADMLAAMKLHGQTFPNFAQFRTTAIEQHLRIRYTRGHVVWTTDDNPLTYFCDPTGRLMSRNQLYFETNYSAPLPDIVCHCTDGVTLRARFYQTGKDIESEILTTSH